MLCKSHAAGFTSKILPFKSSTKIGSGESSKSTRNRFSLFFNAEVAAFKVVTSFIKPLNPNISPSLFLKTLEVSKQVIFALSFLNKSTSKSRTVPFSNISF